MAKTKLLNDVIQKFRILESAVEEASQAAEDQHLYREKSAALSTAYHGARESLAAAKKHADDLNRRVSDNKTVTDRIRNLKNIFKNSAELKASRDEFKRKLAEIDEAFGEINESWWNT